MQLIESQYNFFFFKKPARLKTWKGGLGKNQGKKKKFFKKKNDEKNKKDSE